MKNENFQKRADFLLGDPEPKARGKVEVSKETRDQFLLQIIQNSCKKRGWKMEWIDIDIEAQTINIDHSLITKEDTMNFFHEVFALAGAKLKE